MNQTIITLIKNAKRVKLKEMSSSFQIIEIMKYWDLILMWQNRFKITVYVNSFKNNYIMKIQSQLDIDFSNTVAKKMGRPSSSKFMNSSDILFSLYKYCLNIDINKLLRAQLKEKFINLIFREYKYYRSDLFMTEYFRIVKKIPHFFVKNFVTQINIK